MARTRKILTLKEMVLQALEEAGGVEYLVDRAHETPAAFLTLVGKVLPTEVAAEHKGEVIAQLIPTGLDDRA